jgi:rubrerythrin
MALDLLQQKGVPIDRQRFTWRELVSPPISKLDDDAFTRVRVILMNGIEAEAVGFLHSLARFNRELQLPAARVRRVDHHQATMINWLLSPDHSPLETTIAYEQVAIEVTAHVAQHEPDEYLAQVYRFGLLEDFDHLHAYSALLDRLEGKDSNAILQGYSDVLPGRRTVVEHRAPEDDLRHSYDRKTADPLSKLNALTIMAGEQQTRNYYMNIGPIFADPVARQLYAEIASIEEQHVTQYECLCDADESWLEKWVLHEATEVWNYWSCARSEENPRIRALWERFLDYELGHLNAVMQLFEKHEKRDAAEILPETLPEPIPFDTQREFVRKTLAKEVDLRTNGTEIVPKSKESALSREYRRQINADGSPSELVSAGYKWAPGSELKLKAA